MTLTCNWSHHKCWLIKCSKKTPANILLFSEGLLDNVTVLIGIAYGGKAIAGVINQPFYNYQVQTKLNNLVS